MFNFKLKYIEVGPFRSFIEPQRIDLPESGLILIEGKNLDTGGSSRSGKTNLLLGLEYVYGTAPYSQAAMVSWYAPDQPATFKIGLLNQSGLIELSRSNKLEITENGKQFSGSAKQKDEHLENNILGLNKDIRQALTYRGQRTNGLFLSKNNSEKTEFLIPLLELDKFEQADKTTSDKIKKLNEKVDGQKGSLGTLEELYNSIKNEPLEEIINKINLIKVVVDKYNNDIKQAKENQESARIKNESDAIAAKEYCLVTCDYAREQEKLNQLQTNKPIFIPDNNTLDKLKENLDELNKRLNKLIFADEDKKQLFDEETNVLKKLLRDSTKEYNNHIILQENKTRYINELESLKKNTCPTCFQVWLKAQDKVFELENKIIAHTDQITKLLELEPLIKRTQSDLDSRIWIPDPNVQKFVITRTNLEKQIAIEQTKIESQRREFNSKFAQQVTEAKNTISTIQFEAEKQYNQVKYRWSEINKTYIDEITYLENERNSNNSTLNQLNQQSALIKQKIQQKLDIEKQLFSKKAESEQISTELNTENDFSHLIGREGFLNAIFEEKLQAIGDEVNNTLSQVANTRDVVFEFKTESLTSKGTIKKNIVPIVTVNGNTDKMESVLSGGMLSTVELAVDLAVRNVISHETGVVPGYLILDECFNGLDTVSKEACFQLLKIYANDILILVIDHSTEFKALFDKVITIQYSRGISKIVDSV